MFLAFEQDSHADIIEAKPDQLGHGRHHAPLCLAREKRHYRCPVVPPYRHSIILWRFVQFDTDAQRRELALGFLVHRHRLCLVRAAALGIGPKLGRVSQFFLRISPLAISW